MRFQEKVYAIESKNLFFLQVYAINSKNLFFLKVCAMIYAEGGKKDERNVRIKEKRSLFE